MNITPELREYAEAPDRYAYIGAGSSVSRFDDGRICIVQGSTWAGVSAPNVADDEVGALLAATRELIPADKATTWWIGPSAQPVHIVERLQELGLRPPHDRITHLVSLVLTDPPAPIPDGIEVRRIETYDDFADAREVQWDAFDVPEDRRAKQRPYVRTDFDDSVRFGTPAGFIASLDGRPAASALSLPSDRGVFLIAGAVAEWARGRGLYRALVRARWDDAVKRGTPALVTQANPETSYPILRSLGFEEVCQIRRLEDAR